MRPSPFAAVMKQIRKVIGLVVAVLTPFIALSAFAMVEMGAQARQEFERTIRSKVDGCMAATEREVARHLTAVQTLGAMLDVDLPRLRRYSEVMLSQMRPDWLTVALAEGERQVFNLRLPPGAPLPRTIDPAANEQIRRSGKAGLGGVTRDESRLPEPFVILRAPVFSGSGAYVLLVATRAWAFSETIRECGLPGPEWRIGLVDSNLRIVARTASGDPHDPYIGQPITSSFREGLTSGRLFFVSDTVDGLRTYVGVAASKRYGWIASVSVPIVEVEEAVVEVWMFAGGIAAAGLMAAGVTCFLALRIYGKIATTRKLTESLREKETLLREIHHRVKNNLQAMWGMMKFECANIRDPLARERMEVVMARMLVLGRIHQQLYESESLSRINFAAHLAELVDSVRQTVDPEKVRLELDVELLSCDIEVALPLGLITYELITNACKHAFPDGRAGTITVSLRSVNSIAAVCLTVRDDGAGPCNGSSPGIGMVLVRALAGQVEGTVEVAYNNGCCAEVTLPGRLFVDG